MNLLLEFAIQPFNIPRTIRNIKSIRLKIKFRHKSIRFWLQRFHAIQWIQPSVCAGIAADEERMLIELKPKQLNVVCAAWNRTSSRCAAIKIRMSFVISFSSVPPSPSLRHSMMSLMDDFT